MVPGSAQTYLDQETRSTLTTRTIHKTEVFAVLRACLGLAGRAGMPKHRLQPGKSRGFRGPYVRLGASTKLERLVDFLNSFYGPSPAMSPQPSDASRIPTIEFSQVERAMPSRLSTYRNLDLLHTEDLRICYAFGTHRGSNRNNPDTHSRQSLCST